MSMLTPPGMGGKYRITGDRYPRMRRPPRRRRLAVTGVAAACVLGLAGWGVTQLVGVFGGGGEQAHASSVSCREKQDAGHTRTAKDTPAALPGPHDITVNVLNATSRDGLAKTTADELKKRGFRVGKVGNAEAPYDKVKGSAVLVGAKGSTAKALKVLGTQVHGAGTRGDHRKGGDVDLVIGDGFTKLTSAGDAKAALAALAKPAADPHPSRPAHPAC